MEELTFLLGDKAIGTLNMILRDVMLIGQGVMVGSGRYIRFYCYCYLGKIV